MPKRTKNARGTAWQANKWQKEDFLLLFLLIKTKKIRIFISYMDFMLIFARKVEHT
jgi:hypothetical protein